MSPFERCGSVYRDGHDTHAAQWSSVLRYVVLAVLLVSALMVAGCEEQTAGVPITGIDHLPDHLSVQQFYVDGYSAFQAGTGARTVCCAVLPMQWRPGLSIEVRWNVTNWRDCEGHDYVRRVPVERYEEPDRLWVHFMADGSIRAVSSGVGPGNPAYPGPHERIPSKNPWDVYSIEAICKVKHGGPNAVASAGDRP